MIIVGIDESKLPVSKLDYRLPVDISKLPKKMDDIIMDDYNHNDSNNFNCSNERKKKKF